MPRCECCGSKFKLSDARDEYNAAFEEEGYDYDEMCDGDLCGECAIERTNEGMPEGAEIIELMGPGWDPD